MLYLIKPPDERSTLLSSFISIFIHCILHWKRHLFNCFLHIRKWITVILQRMSKHISNTILLIWQYFMEHISRTSFQMKRIVRLIQNLLILLKPQRMYFSKLFTFTFKCIKKMFHLFFRSHKTFYFTYSCWILFTYMNIHFYCCHIALWHPVETVNIV